MTNITFILGNKRFEKVSNFDEMLQEVMNDGNIYNDIKYGLEFSTKEEAIVFMEKLPKVMQKKITSYNDKFIVKWSTNISRDGAFINKNVKSRIEKIITLLNSSFNEIIEEEVQIQEKAKVEDKIQEKAKVGDKIKLISEGSMSGLESKVKIVSEKTGCYIIVVKGLNYTIPFDKAVLIK